MTVDLDAIRKLCVTDFMEGKAKELQWAAEELCNEVETLREEMERTRCKYTASQEALTEFLTEHRMYYEAWEWVKSIYEIDKPLYTEWLAKRSTALEGKGGGDG